jgi:predicted ABC-type ATPase
VPTLTVIAGPNGSGKSTITAGTAFDGKENLLDPDAIAKRISPANPANAAVTAAREVIDRTHTFIARGQSFAIETTLAGRHTLAVMEDAKRNGFRIRLLYVCLDQPERNVLRVGERVSKGGHHVPDADVARRYARSLANLKAAIRIADEAVAYDNSALSPRQVFEARHGLITWRAPNLPAWANCLSEPENT